MVHETKFYADFKNPFLNCRKWGDLGEKVVFLNLPSTIFSENRKIILMDIPGHVRYPNECFYTLNNVVNTKCIY